MNRITYVISLPPLASGAISFDPLCISQNRNSRLCLAGNATREKMRSLGNLLGSYVSKTLTTPHHSCFGCGLRWSAACAALDNPNKADSLLSRP